MPGRKSKLVWREGAAGVAPVLRSFIDIAMDLAGAIGLTQDNGIKA